MAVVRQPFIDKVSVSAHRGQLRHLDADAAAGIRDVLAALVENAVLAHRTGEAELIKILDSGRLKPQAEVQSDKHPDRDPHVERSVWTINDADERHLPIHGYAATVDDVSGEDGGYLSRMSLRDAYGLARVVYRPELRRRSTFTVGDSKWPLEHDAVAPGNFEHPSELAWSPMTDVCQRDLDHCTYHEIVEVQTLGGIYVEDIELVILDAEPQPETAAQLDEHHVFWRVSNWPNPTSVASPH